MAPGGGDGVFLAGSGRQALVGTVFAIYLEDNLDAVLDQLGWIKSGPSGESDALLVA